MNNIRKPMNLPVLAAGLGGVALVLRRLLYTLAVDEKNLLPVNHPLEIGLGILSAAVLLYLLLAVRKLDGSDRYEDNFFPSRSALAGHCAGAVGFWLTAMSESPMMAGWLGTFWKLMGLLAPVCLLLAGFARLQGKRPFFVLHMIPCLFLVLWLVDHYQLWSGNPQLQDYVFTMLGVMALIFFAFYTTAFDVDAGKRRMQVGMGLAAVYLLLAELAVSDSPWLSLGGILWVLTNLCSLAPAPETGSEGN